MLHTSYYTKCFDFFDYNILNYHVEKAHDPSIDRDVADFRFNEHIDYQGIGNSDLMRVNACAVLRIHFWCLKPEKTWRWTVVKYVANVLVKPFAALHDLVLNVAFLVAKVVMAILIVIGKLLEKAYDPSKNVELWNATKYSLKNAYCQLEETVIASCIFAMYQLATLTTVNLLGPKYDPFFRLGDQYNWSYWVNYDEQIFDDGRVRYLQEKCGWKDVPLQVFKDHYKPWINMQAFKVKYDKTRRPRVYNIVWTITTQERIR